MVNDNKDNFSVLGYNVDIDKKAGSASSTSTKAPKEKKASGGGIGKLDVSGLGKSVNDILSGFKQKPSQPTPSSNAPANAPTPKAKKDNTMMYVIIGVVVLVIAGFVYFKFIRK